jgi:hypothetical protein
VDLHGHPDRFASGEAHAGVAGVPGGDPLSVPEDLVGEAQGDPAGLGEVGSDYQLVVEKGGRVVVDECLDDHEAEAPPFEVLVGEASVAQPLDAAYLEVGEVVGVVDVALGVYLRVADPERRLADYGSTGP